MEQNVQNENFYEDGDLGDSFYDTDIMYELVRQFIESLDGNESKEKLETLITHEAAMIHEQVPEIPVDFIIQEIKFRMEK